MKWDCFALGWMAKQRQNQIKSPTNFLCHVLCKAMVGDPDEPVQEGSSKLLNLTLQGQQTGAGSIRYFLSTKGKHRSPNWASAIPQVG